MKVYVVVEDYTNALMGVFDNEVGARQCAEEVDGSVKVYDLLAPCDLHTGELLGRYLD